MSRKRLLSLVLVSTLAAAAALAWWWPLEEAPPARAALPQRQLEPAAPGAPPAQIPPRPALGEARGEPFASRTWTPPAPAAAPGAQRETPAGPPPMPYRYAGRILRQGVQETLLARGDDLIPVSVGASLAGGYRVESINDERITLRYMPLNVTQTIPVLTLPTADKPQPDAGPRP